jgi:hypothetical protein
MRNEGFQAQAIESGGTGLGVPDVFFAKDGTLGWIELKNMQDDILPDPVKIDFRPGQVCWLNAYSQQGVNVYLAVSCAEGIFFFKNEDIKEEYPLAEFLEAWHIDKMKNIESML